MTWLSNSEINFGRLIKGQVSPTRFDSSLFFPPYDRGFQVLLSGGNIGAIVREMGMEHYNAAIHSIEQLNGTGDTVDWAAELERSCTNAKAADEFERIVKRLKNDEEIDWSLVNKLSSDAQQGALNHFFTLDEVWDTPSKPNWQRSGISFIDNWIGGWPLVGLTVIGGRPKVGKTTFIMAASIAYVKVHPDKNAVIFSIEMTIDQFKKRLKQFEEAGKLTPEERKRIILCEEVVSPETSINWASAIEDVGLMFVDFADLMVQGEVTEPKMTSLYRVLGLGAKQLRTSIILLSQLSGEYKGGIPKPYHVRYTRMAEALVVMNLMLYVPQTDYFDQKDTQVLPIFSDAGYVIKWLTRFETRKNPGIPHAILVKLKKGNTWDIRDKGEFFLLKD